LYIVWLKDDIMIAHLSLLLFLCFSYNFIHDGLLKKMDVPKLS